MLQQQVAAAAPNSAKTETNVQEPALEALEIELQSTGDLVQKNLSLDGAQRGGSRL